MESGPSGDSTTRDKVSTCKEWPKFMLRQITDAYDGCAYTRAVCSSVHPSVYVSLYVCLSGHFCGFLHAYLLQGHLICCFDVCLHGFLSVCQCRYTRLSVCLVSSSMSVENKFDVFLFSRVETVLDFPHFLANLERCLAA